MTQLTEENLNEDQLRILNNVYNDILDYYHEAVSSQTTHSADIHSEKTKECINRSVFAITGPRGWGKTSVMNILRKRLLDNQQLPFYLAEIVDTALVRPDEGLLVTIIQQLHSLFKDTNETPHRHSLNPANNLLQSYNDLFNSALSLNESFRTIAKEMAMSPTHYEEMIKERLTKRSTLNAVFNLYLENLKLYMSKNNFSTSKNEKNKIFVVFIDDLDLAPKEELDIWIRTFNNYFKSLNIIWIFNFHYENMIQSLCNGFRPIITEEDLIIGKSLLSKLVDFERRYPLHTWNFKDRLNFKPFFRVSEQPTLNDLFIKHEITALVLLLPDNPRALYAIYSHLKELKNENTTSIESRKLAFQSCFERLLELNNYRISNDFFRKNTSNQLVAHLAWNESADLIPVAWNNMIQSIKHLNPILGLPLPIDFLNFQSEHSDFNWEGLIEIIFDIALMDHNIFNPLQLIQKMTCTSKRIAKCSATIEIDQHQINSHLKDNISLDFMWSTYWGLYHKSPPINLESQRPSWKFTLSPPLFWEAYYNFRTIKPLDLFSTFHLYNETTDEFFIKTSETANRYKNDPNNDHHLLPKNLRAILLMVDSLQNAPWNEFSSRKHTLPFVSLAQISASFQLSALASCIWPSSPEFIQLLRIDNLTIFFPDLYFQRIWKASEDEIDTLYSHLIAQLTSRTMSTTLDFVTTSAEAQSHTLYTDAIRELYRVLRLTVRLPMVTELRLSSRSQ